MPAASSRSFRSARREKCSRCREASSPGALTRPSAWAAATASSRRRRAGYTRSIRPACSSSARARHRRPAASSRSTDSSTSPASSASARPLPGRLFPSPATSSSPAASTTAWLRQGQSGYVLQSTGSATKWVATSSLGLATGSGSASQVAYFNGTNTLTGAAGFTFDGTNLTVPGTATLTGLSTGLVKSTSGTLGLAVPGTDYAPATIGTSILYGNGAGGFNNASVTYPLQFTGGALFARLRHHHFQYLGGHADVHERAEARHAHRRHLRHQRHARRESHFDRDPRPRPHGHAHDPRHRRFAHHRHFFALHGNHRTVPVLQRYQYPYGHLFALLGGERIRRDRDDESVREPSGERRRHHRPKHHGRAIYGCAACAREQRRKHPQDAAQSREYGRRIRRRLGHRFLHLYDGGQRLAGSAHRQHR